MLINKNVSKNIILDLRDRVQQSFSSSGGVLMNVVDALSVGPRISTPFELVLSPIWGYEWNSLYAGIRRAAEEKGLIAELRESRIEWLQGCPESALEGARVGQWRVRVLDATNYDRPKTETVRISYVHGAEGMKKGHAVSVLSERVGEGSWQLPLENRLIPVERSPTEFGASQVVKFAERYGWEADDLLEVDAAYTNAPTLRPMVAAGVNVLGRVSSKRVFYLPPPRYSGHGRPRVRGKKIKLNDARTRPEPDAMETVEGAEGRRFEVAQWRDVRMRQWPEQPLVLYRIIEYRADGTRRYQRPLWVIYVSKENPAPSLSEGSALYPQRFGVEHSLRFEKGEVGFACGQFNGPGAQARVPLWVELVATA